MHLNISSLQYRYGDLSNKSNIKFSVIGISENWIKNDKPSPSNVNLQDWAYSNRVKKGWGFLYISTQLNYKVRNGLKIYKSKELRSSSIEIMN